MLPISSDRVGCGLSTAGVLDQSMALNGRTIYINGRFLTQPLSGVQRYASEITAQLDERVAAGQASHNYVLLTPKGARQAGLKHIEQRAVGRLTGHGWDQVDFAIAARRGVALSLAASGPITLKRQIVVIHDASVQRFPEAFSPLYASVHRMIGALLARRAQLATVSEFSRHELAAVLSVAAEKIVVAKNGADHLKIVPDMSVLERLGLVDRPYFLTVGNLTRNKNLAVAVRALARLQPTPIQLVAVGRLDAAVFGTGSMPPIGSGLVLAGRLEDSEVAGLMRSARALIFPSLYEGFGIPPLEAMANDCPVLASTAAAVCETCGDAVDYFDPHDDAALAALMQKAAGDDGTWRSARIAAGRARVQLFNWSAPATTLANAAEMMAR